MLHRIDEVLLAVLIWCGIIILAALWILCRYRHKIHSTGAKHRLNRFEPDQFSSETTYSKEELVAELGAAYLSTIAGIEHNINNSAAYVKSWLKVLESNPSWIVWAASKAQKACEFIVPSEVPEDAPF